MKKEVLVVQSEHDSLKANVVWGKLEERSGREYVSLVIKTDSVAVVKILTEGIFYLKSITFSKDKLFRIEHSKRAKIKGCMFLNAVSISHSVRSGENEVLKEMRKILHLKHVNSSNKKPSLPSFHSMAS